ncbi:hypothetical protein CPB84DRAFT_165525 [Gymnopilus junonius]|uniref:Uncharacterized protein n=1 Tax=Gymnopilus junonius TaxID=109634 RepID=A0A9P5NYA4_GYMJU|nr:hypothetical protein CPB84DRAFT_165525 [Gymnopilus junonius]
MGRWAIKYKSTTPMTADGMPMDGRGCSMKRDENNVDRRERLCNSSSKRGREGRMTVFAFFWRWRWNVEEEGEEITDRSTRHRPSSNSFPRNPQPSGPLRR